MPRHKWYYSLSVCGYFMALAFVDSDHSLKFQDKHRLNKNNSVYWKSKKLPNYGWRTK